MQIILFFVATLFVWPSLVDAEQKPLKILHLTFHKGCVKEIEAVAKILGHELTTWWIPGLPARFLDGISEGNALYNMGHERAERVWDLHKETFEQFDLILTSDTAPLARIFLQNGYKKPLIIWICCRFDYCDQQSLDCHFPDPEFYQLFDQASSQENVTIIAYTAFEHYYAEKRGVGTGKLVITPCAPDSNPELTSSLIPSSILKKETFFLPPYWNETRFMNLSEHCTTLGIPNFCGKYNGPADLKDFKGIIHLPYAWSNLAFFENIALGLPYFIPSRSFLKSLLQQSNYWHTNPHVLTEENQFALSEWYQPGREEVIIYFDSWEDLQEKIRTTDYLAVNEQIRNYAKEYQRTMLEKWSVVFKKLNEG
jgi:hypothetical protein